MTAPAPVQALALALVLVLLLGPAAGLGPSDEGQLLPGMGCAFTFAPGEQAPQPCSGQSCVPQAPNASDPLVACTEYLPAWRNLVCCKGEQTQQLKTSMPLLESTFASCRACIDNFWTLFCAFTCSPYQAQFANVTSTLVRNNQTLVNSTAVRLAAAAAEAHYASCKNIPIGGGQVAYELWGTAADFFAYIGLQNTVEKLLFQAVNASNATALDYQVEGCAGVCGCETCPAECQAPPDFDPGLNATRCHLRLSPHLPPVDCLGASLAAALAAALLLLAALAVLSAHRLALLPRPLAVAVGLGLALLVAGGLLAYLLSGGAAWSVWLAAALLAAALLAALALLPAPAPARAAVLAPGRLEINAPAAAGRERRGQQSLLHRYWHWHGRAVGSHPLAVLAVCALLVAACASGLAFLQVQEDPVALWVSPGSRAAQDKAYFDAAFGPFYRVEQLIVTRAPNASAPGADPRVLVADVLTQALALQLAVRQLTAPAAGGNGSVVRLEELCVRPVPPQMLPGTEVCLVESALEYFQADPATLASYAASPAALAKFLGQCTTSPLYAECVSDIGVPIDANVVLGGYEGTAYLDATALVLTFLLNNPSPSAPDYALQLDAAMRWEAAFIAFVRNASATGAFPALAIAFSAERSVQDELARESGADVRIIAISYALMLAYVALALGGLPRRCSAVALAVRSRCLLALAGVVLVACSVAASAGLNSALGVQATLIISEVIPFLVLAIGVDNIFILVSAFDATDPRAPVPERLGAALAEVGSGVVVAGSSEAVAFLLGSLTRMPAVQAFAFYASLAILFDFLLQLTAFVALLALDARRVAARRLDCFPCVAVAAAGELADAEEQEQEEEERKGQEAPLVDSSQPLLAKAGGRGGRGAVRWVMERAVAPAVLHPVGKWALLAAFLLALACGLQLGTQLDVGLDQRVALPSDSYLIPYFDQEAALLQVGPPLYIVVKGPDYNYSDPAAQDRLCYSQAGCAGASVANFYDAVPYVTPPVYSWVDDYLSWATSPITCCFRPGCQGPDCACFTSFIPDVNSSSLRPRPADFEQFLPAFLDFVPPAFQQTCQIPGFVYLPDLVWAPGSNQTTLAATRLRAYHTVLRTQSDYINALRIAYEVADATGLEVFPYSVFYIYFEQYLYIVNIALLDVGLALAGVFVVSLLLLGDPWLALLIVGTVGAMEAQLLGAMQLWGISLNAVSVTNLVMAVGIAIEFCVHIAARFAQAEGTREQRAWEALVTMGSSVFSGITMTKFVGVAVLAFSASEIFRVYYFRMYLLIVLLGAAHGLVLLPILLSILGTQSVRRCLDATRHACLERAGCGSS